MKRNRILIWAPVCFVAGLLVAGAIGQGGGAAADDGAAKPEYGGPGSCKACHFKQHKSWEKSALAKAFEALKPGQEVEKKKAAKLDPEKDYSTDATCLKCHTTGYGRETGYPALAEGESMTEQQKERAALTEGVTCEACHGPGSLYGPFKKKNKDYKRAEIVALGALAPVGAGQCQDCHVKECPTMGEDYAFDFEKAKTSDAMHEHKPLKKEH
jgi:hypothetical protein